MDITRQLEQAKTRLDKATEQRFTAAIARTLGHEPQTVTVVHRGEAVQALTNAFTQLGTALAEGLRSFADAVAGFVAPLMEYAERRRRAKQTCSRAHDLVTRRLHLAGITGLVPMEGGITPRGYFTIDEPTRLVRGDELAKTFHPWRHPAGQVRGILAAAKAAARADVELRKLGGR